MQVTCGKCCGKEVRLRRFGFGEGPTLLALSVLEASLFSRSLSVLTVSGFVGYVIGLGDRHGSNILVDQLTWGALHIDFGDVNDCSH